MDGYQNPLLTPAVNPSYSNPLTDPRLFSPTPVAPVGREPGMSSFQTGLNAGLIGTQMGLRGFAANIAETAGFPEYAKSQLTEINSLRSRIPRGRVERLEDIQGIGDIPEFAAYSTGQALPTIATAAAGGLGARGALSAMGVRASPYAAEFAGSMAGVLPQEAGEAAINMYSDPQAMARTTPAERTALMLGKGTVGAALESIVPASVVGRVAAPARQVVEPGFMGSLRHVGKEGLKAAGLESLTEGAQQISGQAFQSFANPNQPLMASKSDILNAMAAGFIPGGAMGTVGGAIDVVKDKLAQPVQKAVSPLTSMLSSVRNPQLSAFVNTLAPEEVKAQGVEGVTRWLMENPDAFQQTLRSAADVAADESLPDFIRAGAQRVVDTNGSPESLRDLTGLAASHQQGLEFGNTLKELMNTSFQAANGVLDRFRNKTGDDTKFSAMELKPTPEEEFVQSQVTPYLSSKDPNQTRAATYALRDYLLSAAEDPAARMPAGLMNLFEPGKAQEGMKAAYNSLYRAGLIGQEASEATSAKIDDAIQRQSAWKDLISTELAPQHGTPSDKDISYLSTYLEAASTKDSDEFMAAAKLVFGNNVERALTRMEPLLPQTTGSLLERQLGAPEEVGQLAAATEMTPSLLEQTSAQMGETGSDALVRPQDNATMSVQDFDNRIKWGMLREGAYDIANPQEAQFLQENRSRADRSGVTETGPVGVVDYTKRTNDGQILADIQQKNPEMSLKEINDRFKVLATYQKTQPDTESVTYDELMTKGTKENPNTWRTKHYGEGAIKFYEPGAKQASYVATADTLISNIRRKAGQLKSDLVGPEQNMADFSRGLSSVLSTEKNGKIAFDKVTIVVKDPKGKNKFATKEVPLSELPDSFQLFPNVSVKDVKQQLQERGREGGIQKPRVTRTGNESLVNRETDVKMIDKTASELAASFLEAEDKLKSARRPEAVAALQGKMKAIVSELVTRIEEAGLDATAEGVIRQPSPQIDRQLPPRTPSDEIGDRGSASLEQPFTRISGPSYAYEDIDKKTADAKRREIKAFEKKTGTQSKEKVIKTPEGYVLRREVGFKTERVFETIAETEGMGQQVEDPRLYDEWGLPTDPRESVYIRNTTAGASAAAVRLANLLQNSTKESKRKDSLIETLREIYSDTEQTPDRRLKRIEAVERSALVEGFITEDQTERRHFFSKNGKPIITQKKETAGVETKAGEVSTTKWLDRNEMRANPNNVYVFGDNVARRGFGGQAAVARDMPNAFGIPTKYTPATHSQAFFGKDVEAEKKIITDSINQLIEMKLAGKNIVIPEDGLGTGRAELQQRAPEVFDHLNNEIQRLKDATSDTKFNAQNSRDLLISEPMLPEDKAAVTEWLNKVLPEPIIEFVTELGGMSGSFSRNNVGKALIKINVFAYDPNGVAYHEALHALFSELRAGKHTQTLNTLNNVAMSGRVQAKLKELLAGNDRAIEQLREPEEAAAYMFQFWMQDKITLGPQTETFFQKLTNAIKKFFGFIHEEQLIEEMFKMFASGQMKDPVMRDAALAQINEAGYQRMAKYIKPVMDKAAPYIKSVDTFFRDSGNEKLIQIIDLFENTTGVATNKLGYFKAVEQARNHTLNKLSEDLRNVDKATLNAAITELQRGTDPDTITNDEVKKVVAMSRKVLDQLYDYMSRKNVTVLVKMGDRFQRVPVRKAKNYFPRVWSMEALLANPEEFVDKLVQYHSDELTRLNGDVTPREVAEAILAKLVRNLGVADDDASDNDSSLREDENILGFSPAMASANERVLNFLDMKQFDMFLEKDYVNTMTRYIHQAIKKAEYSVRFGSDGKLLEEMMNDAAKIELDKIMTKEYGSNFVSKRDALLARNERQAGESQEAFESRVLGPAFQEYDQALTQAKSEAEKVMAPYRQSVMALEGTLGHDISPTLRKVNSTLGAYQNLRLLPLALFSSIIDPLGIVVRGGKMSQAKAAFLRGMKEVYRGWKGEFTGAEDPDVKLAEMLGTLEASTFLDSLGQMYGSMFVTSGARRVNDMLFRVNGMEGWNRAMRTQATLAAIDFIKDLNTPSEKNTRYMEELGLTQADIALNEEGKVDLTNPNVRQAVMRWVDGAILRPNAAQRPAWASNPKFALVFHLMQFTYSFQKEIMGRAIYEAKHGNIDPALTLALGYVPVMMAASMARAVIQGGGEPPEYMKNDSLFDWVQRGVFQSGIMGVPGAGIQGAEMGDSLGGKVFNAAASYTGPTIKQAIDAVNDDLGTTTVKAMPLQPVYRHWFD